MKKLIAAGLIFTLVLSVLPDASAAGKTKNQNGSSPTSKKGYWILQPSEKNSKEVTILYYNNSNYLVRKETRLKKNADIRRKKVLRSLKRTLEEAVDWAEPI